MGTIHSIVYQIEPSENKEPYRFNRVLVESVNLIANHGIEGDRKAGRNPKRQLNIMSLNIVQQLGSEGFKIQPGELGEQIVIRDVDVTTLSRGSRLQLGESAIIELTMERAPCEWFALIQDKNHEDAAGRVGMMARVIEGGMIRIGDAVTILEVISATES